MKLGSDPAELEIRGDRLFIFGDVLGHEMWKLDERDHRWRAREGFGRRALGMPGE